MASHVRPGDPAPDFELDGTDGRFRLSDHRGERVVLLFYPGDETPVCTRQFCSYRDRAEEMATLPAVVVGISGQDLSSHEAFRDHHDLNVPLLADPDRTVARLYGVTAPLIGTRRSVIVIDRDGTIAHRDVSLTSLTYASVDDLRAILDGLRGRD